MQPGDTHSRDDVTQWIRSLESGDETAAAELWDYCFPKLLKYSRKKLPDHLRRVLDEEDVALSVFKSFCVGVAKNSLGDIRGRDELWKLLYCITSRKAQRYIQYQVRQKRGGGQVSGESVFQMRRNGQTPRGIDQVAGDEETPEMKAEIAEQCQHLMDKLADEMLQTIALLRLEGYCVNEIAARVGCAKRSVERRIQLIRTIWKDDMEPSSTE